ncbi:hypothetical protein BSKO_01806 [Bryopsis sp. KO-2023]|nr:hypothetical protein BSKO_01806 [Bryopsis sp. KO-2023]
MINVRCGSHWSGSLPNTSFTHRSTRLKRDRRRPSGDGVRWTPTPRALSENGEIPIGGGESIRLPKKREGIWPSFDLTKEEALEIQMKALENNNDPYIDHGIEVLYRFANVDPFERSNYFGCSQDLGQFEKFRRMLHLPRFIVLLGHTERKVLSTLQVSDSKWKQRIWVTHKYRRDEEAIFEFTMIQRLGGRYDAYFFTDSLSRES